VLVRFKEQYRIVRVLQLQHPPRDQVAHNPLDVPSGSNPVQHGRKRVDDEVKQERRERVALTQATLIPKEIAYLAIN
jgi:hypothetical protein